MRPVLSRLRAPEWAIGAVALALGLSLALDWYGSGHRASAPGSHLTVALGGFAALQVVRWVIIASSLAGLGTWWLQASRRAPALPICATVVTFVLASVAAVLVLIRVAIAQPAAAQPRAGAFVGLALALALAAGAYRSMRRDGIRPEDGPERIETIALGPGPGEAASGPRSASVR